MSGLYVTSVTYDNWRMMMKERNDRRMISQLAGTGPESKESWLRAKKKSFDQWQYHREVCLYEAETNFHVDIFLYRCKVSI